MNQQEQTLVSDLNRNRLTFVNDTLTHIRQVQGEMNKHIAILQYRAQVHDVSKLEEPELSRYAETIPKLAGLEYGTEEYQAVLQEMKPAIQHHYKENPHHPEHYDEGINDMTLVDLIEMISDHKAAAARGGKNALDNLEYNCKRFGIGDQLKKILRNSLLRVRQENEAAK